MNKKLLEALKAGELTLESLPPCLSAFHSLMESNLSPDLLRSLALSITYVLHRPSPHTSLKKKKSLRFAAPSSRPGSSKSGDSDKYLSSTALGTEMMRLYSALLCNPIDSAPLKKFARAVTNKVCPVSPSEAVACSDSVHSGFYISHAKTNRKLSYLQQRSSLVCWSYMESPTTRSSPRRMAATLF